MKELLYRLVYISHSCIEGNEAKILGDIQSILETARTENRKLGVTGALMFNAGCFAQVLEGEQAHVEQTFERIQNDLRHEDVSVLSFEPSAERFFNEWSMAYVGADASAQQEFADVAGGTGFDASSISSERVVTLLREHFHQDEQNKQQSTAA